MVFLAAFLEEGFADNLFGRLLMGIVPVVILVALFSVAVRIASRRTKAQLKVDKMLEEDEAASRVRPKEIADDFYFKIDVAELPIREYTDDEEKTPHSAYFWQKKVLALCGKKMLHFDRPFSNVELKQMFGMANLEFVARYEENFTNFIHALRHWAEALINTNNLEDAQKVLEIANCAGSEISQTYTLLADIYAKQNNLPALKALKTQAEQSPLPNKSPTLTHIKNLF
ncbi:MAG: hypothetical protein LBE35_09190 [Clostridiales bacterium]|jgi:tetratricopeptide (TPR) repeat protein|nr:hypothetical protein [Clostridiales bacterium]